MTKRKWIVLITGSFLAFSIWFAFFFRDVQTPKWTEHETIRSKLLEETDIVKIDKLHKHVWNQVAWVAIGTNQAEEPIALFYDSNEQSQILKAAESMSEEELRTIFKTSKPEAVVLDIKAGLYNGEPVWEIQYKSNESDTRTRYEFYTFQGGVFIDSFQLPAKKRS